MDELSSGAENSFNEGLRILARLIARRRMRQQVSIDEILNYANEFPLGAYTWQPEPWRLRIGDQIWEAVG